MTMHKIITWTRDNGEALAIARLRMQLIPFLAQEKVDFDNVTPSTQFSPEAIAAASKAASLIVGTKCPFK